MADGIAGHLVAAGGAEEARPAPAAEHGLRRFAATALSLRGRIILTIAAIGLAAGAVAAAIVVYNAKRSAEIEITAAMQLAERLVREVVQQPQFQRFPRLEEIPARIGSLRHVRIMAAAGEGGRAALLPPVPGGGEKAEPVPAWFARLVGTEDVRREMQVVSGGRHIGSVLVVGNASDEIAEVWRETRDLFFVALLFAAAVLAVIHFALGRLLDPLVRVAEGLGELERGEFRHRLARPDVLELAAITERFNALAARLADVRLENRRLSRSLVSVQDVERRRLASELHDEIGPCLFGIQADIASLDRLADRAPADLRERLRERLATLEDVTARIRVLNRGMLDRLRPMALDHLPLSEVIGGLVADFQRHGQVPKIGLETPGLAERYDDAIMITVHRCVQEGVTNVLRHAGARTLAIRLAEVGAKQGEPGSSLRLTLDDDGVGLKPGIGRGHGLTGMEERVRALGGELRVGTGPGGQGTRLAITIPLGARERPRHAGEELS